MDNYKPDFTFESAAAESIKDEESFALNVFGETEKFRGLIGLATRIQTLLLMEKGQNPSAVDAGVGIRNYLMEAFDDLTQDELRGVIRSQLRQYLPTDQIIDFTINFIDESNTRTGTLYLLFTVYDPDNPDIAGEFAISFGKDNGSFKSSSVGSKIYM